MTPEFFKSVGKVSASAAVIFMAVYGFWKLTDLLPMILSKVEANSGQLLNLEAATIRQTEQQLRSEAATKQLLRGICFGVHQTDSARQQFCTAE